jgi:acyl-CoA synthetase (AMP-forming)/AMP-acid ligase II
VTTPSTSPVGAVGNKTEKIRRASGSVSFTLAGIIRDWACRSPNNPALIFDGRTLTWQTLYERSGRVAAILQRHGVAAQNRVAFLGKNSFGYFEVLFGVAMLNAVTVAVNWRLAAPEIAAIIHDSQSRILFVDEEFLPLVADREQVPLLQTVISLSSSGGQSAQYETLLRQCSPVDPLMPIAEDDVAMQLYTSGTTGLPKGVMITNRNLAGFMRCAELIGLSQDAAALVAMPLFHIGGAGWALLAMNAGARSVVLREFEATAAVTAIVEERLTHILLVPAMMRVIVTDSQVPSQGFGTLKALVYGASPISDDLIARALTLFGCDFYQWYGMTETTSAVTQLGPEDHIDPAAADRRRSAGRAIGDAEIRIVDVCSGGVLLDGQVGEICVRSQQVAKGYWCAPEGTTEAISADGWLRTGDAGYLDDGYLYLHDRIKDMIISGGENVYPAEVENVLSRHPDVADVAVIGIPSDTWGEAVKAIVVRVRGSHVTGEDLREFARVTLAGYKVPKSVDFVDALPRNPSGKVLKKELRVPYWAGERREVR